MYLKENLLYIRKKHGLSQSEFGIKINASGQKVSNWERGYTSNLSIETLIKVSSYFGVTVDDLLKKDLSKEEV